MTQDGHHEQTILDEEIPPTTVGERGGNDGRVISGVEGRNINSTLSSSSGADADADKNRIEHSHEYDSNSTYSTVHDSSLHCLSTPSSFHSSNDDSSPPLNDLEKQDTKGSASVPNDLDGQAEGYTLSTFLSRQTTTDRHGNTYPEGGFRAWLVVYGAFSGMTASFGLMNSIGTFQAYLSDHQLAEQEVATLGWVFSLYTFLSFFLGIQIGPLFDAKGPRVLVFLGSLCLIGGTLGIAESTKLWHFILSFSIAGGLGTALIFTPAIASIAHFFLIKRAAATGLAATGGSVGGIIYPLMLQKLFPEIGFQWATRVLALIFLVQLIVANLLIRSRLPPPPKELAASIWPDFKIFKNVTFCLTTGGTFFVEWALFVPLSYLTAYALKQGVSAAFSYELLAILNAGSFFGRWIPGIFADSFGRFNAMIVTVAICMISVLCLWLTASLSDNIIPQLIVFSVIFGFGSGSNISLVPVCVGQLCDTEVFGRWYASLYTIVAFGCLTGIPVAGSILDKDGGNYTGLICFVGICYGAGLICFLAARVREVGWSLKQKY